MDEIAYLHYCKKGKEAEAIYNLLREMYGEDMNKSTLSRRAFFDGVITAQERQLLVSYALG